MPDDSPNARLQRVEVILEQVAASQLTIQEAVKASIASQARSYETLQEGLQAVAASQVRVHETLADLNTAVAQYTAAADARMRRIEENLDSLIRAITPEHTNGKAKL